MNKEIDGKEISNKIKEELQEEINLIKERLGLVVIQVGHNSASEVYVKNKEKITAEMGINFIHLKFPDIDEASLIKEIEKLNNDKEVTGIIVQLPLPKHLNEDNILNAIDYRKDVDGLTSNNIGKLFSNLPCIVPCTALAVIKILEHVKVELKGKSVTIIGRSRLVGIPLVNLLLRKNCTVSICHSKTENLNDYTKNADILIVAVGKKHFITKEMIKENVIIIDVGINRVHDKVYGDVFFEDVYDKCHLITPVPKGVGAMTVIMLINNLIECYKIQN